MKKETKKQKESDAKKHLQEIKNDLLKLNTFEWFDNRFYKVEKPEPDTLPEHIYNNGVCAYYPSVTTILNVMPKPWLARFYGEYGYDMAKQKVNQALDKGSAVHLAIDKGLNGRTIIYGERQVNTLESDEKEKIWYVNEQQIMYEVYKAKLFLEAIGGVILSTEMPVLSHEHFFAGTCDLIVQVETDRTVQINGSKPIKLKAGNYCVDWKTGNQVDQESGFRQLSSYAMALREMGINIDGSILVHTNSQTKSGIEGLSSYVIYGDELEYYFDKFLLTKKFWEMENPPKPQVFNIPQIIKFGE